MTDKQTKMKILAKQFGEMAKNPNMKAFFPDKTNPFIWHVSYKGPQDSDFQGGIYHCHLNLAHYPECAPEVMLLHENGSYNPNELLCIVGITHYHQEGWTPGTSIEAIITALQMLMQVTTGRGGIGVFTSLDQKQILKDKEKSLTYTCKCGANHAALFK
ncbi:Ubiquitin-conjugating_enzyme E2 [Hexamita inflata]|uniref:Ubiquitin-conjugating enzyme E2 n=1 Tax=Hexamita inflata TaxID=28002 RepID=A0AA86QDD1_9EUKA|nr:Ubiquitin-conjugating enzyme E2 [Hexamita inflata]